MTEQQPVLFREGELAEAPAKNLTDAVEVWNEFAKKNRWQVARVLDAARRTALKRAINDYGGLLGFRQALAKVERNRFIMGKVTPREGHKQFVANLDWFIRPVTVRKVLEDFYEDDGGQNGVSQGSSFSALLKSASFDWDGQLARYRPGGFWHVPTMGPRPEDNGPHKVPAEKLATWRAKHKIVERKTESREERLTAMIASYRKVGNYARANELEAELSALTGQPAVQVPAPDVAHVGLDDMPKIRPEPVDVAYDEIPEGDPDSYGDADEE